MRVGTKTVLFGVHAFWIHPILVGLSWRKIYKVWPGWPEWVAIFLHDNYWGLPNIDGVEGKQHPARNAKLARWLGGRYAEELVRFHSRAFCREAERNPSALCAPDKYSILLEPEWFYLWRAKLSGEINEFVANAMRLESLPFDATYKDWLRGYKEKVMNEFAHVIYLPLSQGRYAKVDANAPEEIWGNDWYVSGIDGKYYAARHCRVNGKRSSLTLHRAVLGNDIPSGAVIDHINGDTLDNRRSNLRVCSQAQNMLNRVKHTAGGSRYKGVAKRKSGRYRADIRLGGVRKYLGDYDDEESAARAYNAAAKELFGEFARLNPV